MLPLNCPLVNTIDIKTWVVEPSSAEVMYMPRPRPTGAELGSGASVIGSSVTKTVPNEVKLQILPGTLSTAPFLEQAQRIRMV